MSNPSPPKPESSSHAAGGSGTGAAPPLPTTKYSLPPLCNSEKSVVGEKPLSTTLPKLPLSDVGDPVVRIKMSLPAAYEQAPTQLTSTVPASCAVPLTLKMELLVSPARPTSKYPVAPCA